MPEKLNHWIQSFTHNLHMTPLHDEAEPHGCGKTYTLPDDLGRGTLWFCKVDTYLGLAMMDLTFSEDFSMSLGAADVTYFSFFDHITAVYRAGDGDEVPLSQRTLYTNAEHPQAGTLVLRAETRVKGVLILLESDFMLSQLLNGRADAVSGLNGRSDLPEVMPVVHQIRTSRFTCASEVASLFYRAKAQELVLLFANSAVGNRQLSARAEERWQEDWEGIHAVTEFMKRNLSENAHIPVHAQMVHMSPAKLRYTFKAVTGKTLREFRNDLKGEQALKLLEHTELPLPTIASDLGFSSTSNFARFFRARYQVSPMAYRQHLRDEELCGLR